MKRHHAGWIFRALRGFLRVLSFGYLQVRVEGLEHLPAQGGVLIAGNHPSVLDGMLLLAVSPRPVRFLVAEDLYNHPLINPFFRAMGCIPVLRRGARNGDALHAAVAALEAGEVIGIFPEGTIHRGGSLQEIRPGVALLALKTGVPVVPLGIKGTRESFPDGARFPKPGAVCLRFERPRVYPKLPDERLPERVVSHTLDDIHQELLSAYRATSASPRPRPVPRWFRELQIALTGLVVIPLAGLLTLTAHPSLDSVKLGTQGAQR